MDRKHVMLGFEDTPDVPRTFRVGDWPDDLILFDDSIDTKHYVVDIDPLERFERSTYKRTQIIQSPMAGLPRSACTFTKAITDSKHDQPITARQKAIYTYQGVSPIVRTYKGFLILAENETSYEDKVRDIDREAFPIDNVLSVAVASLAQKMEGIRLPVITDEMLIKAPLNEASMRLEGFRTHQPPVEHLEGLNGLDQLTLIKEYGSYLRKDLGKNIMMLYHIPTKQVEYTTWTGFPSVFLAITNLVQVSNFISIHRR